MAKNTAQRFRFTGEQQDPEVRGTDLGDNGGLYYLRARFYDPANGRFWSRDPLSGYVGAPQTQNAYPYVMNNPARYVDPLGLLSLDPRDLGECIGNRGDCITEPLRDTAHGVFDSGYTDLNVSLCAGVCISGGAQFRLSDGLHWYVGGGVGNPQASFNVTYAPGQHITEGWNCGLQVSGSALISPAGSGGTAGYGFDKEGRFRQNAFGELGASFGTAMGPAAVNYTCIYIF
jgi:RHS repeat-associated protein